MKTRANSSNTSTRACRIADLVGHAARVVEVGHRLIRLAGAVGKHTEQHQAAHRSKARGASQLGVGGEKLSDGRRFGKTKDRRPGTLDTDCRQLRVERAPRRPRQPPACRRVWSALRLSGPPRCRRPRSSRRSGHRSHAGPARRGCAGGRLSSVRPGHRFETCTLRPGRSPSAGRHRARSPRSGRN